MGSVMEGLVIRIIRVVIRKLESLRRLLNGDSNDSKFHSNVSNQNASEKQIKSCLVATGDGIVLEVERLDWRTDYHCGLCGKMVGPKISQRALAFSAQHHCGICNFHGSLDCYWKQRI